MAVDRSRVIAGFFAGLFIISTCMITVAVIYQMIQDSKKSDLEKAATSSAQLTDEQKKQLEATNSKETDVNKLQGTQLAGFTPVANITSLQKIDTTAGSGATVKSSDTVTVDYTGAVASTGIIFESSKDGGKPIALSLNQVIEGWKQGIPGMQVGGTRRLLIPANMAYGSQGQGSIPPNADLVFDVTLVKIGK